MTSPRQLLQQIFADAPSQPVRIINVSCHQERTIAGSGMRAVLPDAVTLVAGPGCAASVCPETDLYQALRLVERHPLSLLVAEQMLHLPLMTPDGPAGSLREARARGLDIRPVETPAEALACANREPGRDMVYVAAGFETLVAPLAGMVLQGLPANLAVLLCGRRVEPLLQRLLDQEAGGFDGLLLPGNRCAVTGTLGWDALLRQHHVPAAVTGYTASGILAGIAAVLRQRAAGVARIDNCYRALVRPAGNPAALAQLRQVFRLDVAEWRGLGAIEASAFVFREPYHSADAYQRYPDYRDELDGKARGMPRGCECAGVLLGARRPQQCAHFLSGCHEGMPYGPCMASEDGTCYLHGRMRRAA